MRVLVTGARGFLGQHLTRALLDRGDEVVGLWLDSTPEIHRLLAGVQGDVCDQRLMERVLSEYEIDTVYHLAARAQVSAGAADPGGAIATNVLGTLSVLEAARRMKTRRVVVASTDKVYGEQPGSYTEDTPLAERNPYGASKACADIVAQTYINAYHMSIGITRCGNLYGPGHRNYSTLIPGTIRKFLRGERPVVRFGGKATRDFLFVEDAVRAYLALGDSTVPGPFNFSGEQPREILDVVQRIAKLLDKNAAHYDIEEGGTGEICKQSLDCSKAERVLGWEPTVDFDAGLFLTVKWYKENLR